MLKATHVILSFEEALKLRLSLEQVLWKLNTFNRALREGRRAAVDICIYPRRRRMVVFEGKLPKTSRECGTATRNEGRPSERYRRGAGGRDPRAWRSPLPVVNNCQI